MKLSLCMIVKDEEKLLSHCLQSVQGLVDQIVVVDTGSCDRTLPIAQSHGAEVYTFAWCDDFAAARNASLQYVTGDWVLVLDADETLVPEMIPQLKQAIRQPDLLVVTLLRREIGAKQSPYTRMSRLFRNHPQIQFHRPYHELIDDSVVALQAQEPHWQIGCLEPVAILHEGYTVERINQQQKAQRAQQIMERVLANNPNDAYLCSKLGALYVENHQFHQGLDLLLHGLDLQPPETSVLYELNYHLGHYYEALGEGTKAQEHYQQALATDLPLLLKIGACNNLANLLQTQGDLEGARQLYESLITAQPNLAIAHNNLGLTLRAMGKLGEAISSYRQAIHYQPDYAEAYQNLGVALFKMGQISDSQQAFQQAIKHHEASTNLAAAHRLRQTLKELGLMT
jgi:tetratricopeptide (TPR) repeat protein